MDFSTPQKLAPIALLRVFSRVLKAIFAQAWPLLVIYFFQVSRPKTGDEGDSYFLILIYVLLVITVLNGVVRYLTYRWSIDGDALIIRHGIIKKVDLRIPFDRIQAIDLQQPWYYRVADTVRFVVDTAGSGGKEAEIWALRVQAAQCLREHILEKRKEGEELRVVESEEMNTAKTWVEVDVLTLFKVGLFRNHFRSIAAFVGGVFYLYSQLQEVIEAEQINDEIASVYAYVPKVFSIVLVLGIFVALAAILFSIILTVIGFYGFKVVEFRDALEAKYGLISVKTRQLKPRKIQIMRTEQGPVFKWLGIIRFKIEQAYAQKVRNKDEFVIPGSPVGMVKSLRERLFGKIPKVVHPKTSRKWMTYRILRFGLLPILMPLTAYYYTEDLNWVWTLLWLPYQVGYSYLLWRNQGIGMDNHSLTIRKQIVFEKLATLKLDRVQSVTIKQSLFQRRNRLCTLVVETAGGSVDLPFLPQAKAHQLANYLLYRSETAMVDWM